MTGAETRAQRRQTAFVPREDSGGIVPRVHRGHVREILRVPGGNGEVVLQGDRRDDSFENKSGSFSRIEAITASLGRTLINSETKFVSARNFTAREFSSEFCLLAGAGNRVRASDPCAAGSSSSGFVSEASSGRTACSPNSANPPQAPSKPTCPESGRGSLSSRKWAAMGLTHCLCAVTGQLHPISPWRRAPATHPQASGTRAVPRDRSTSTSPTTKAFSWFSTAMPRMREQSPGNLFQRPHPG
jgi:hypothetical protein